MDWGAAETVLALGFDLVGCAEVPNYRRSVVNPPMPKDVVDVGLRLSPNFELLQTLRPDLLMINPAQAYLRPSLEHFGPIFDVAIFTPTGDPLSHARAAAMDVARLLGDEERGRRLLARADACLAASRERLANYDGRPVYIAAFVDDRHVALADGSSLFQPILEVLGLKNAWKGASGGWGTTLVGIEDLVAVPEARLVYATPVPYPARRTMAQSPLWLRLPFVREARTVPLPPIWWFGALPSALRMADALSRALGASDADHG